LWEATCFQCCFCTFRVAWGLICLLAPSTSSPAQAFPPPVVSTPSRFYTGLMVSSSFQVKTSDYSCGITSSLPLSYWSIGESSTLPSHTQ
jgi:hypothetical protein